MISKNQGYRAIISCNHENKLLNIDMSKILIRRNAYKIIIDGENHRYIYEHTRMKTSISSKAV